MRQTFSIEIKNVDKTVYFHKKGHFEAPLKETKTYFCEKKLWIPRFGICENMSRATP